MQRCRHNLLGSLGSTWVSLLVQRASFTHCLREAYVYFRLQGWSFQYWHIQSVTKYLQPTEGNELAQRPALRIFKHHHMTCSLYITTVNAFKSGMHLLPVPGMLTHELTPSCFQSLHLPKGFAWEKHRESRLGQVLDKHRGCQFRSKSRSSESGSQLAVLISHIGSALASSNSAMKCVRPTFVAPQNHQR